MIENSEQGLSLSELGAVLSRRRWQFLVPSLLLFVATVIVVVVIPSSYQSQATILIEQQEIPQDLVRSTVTSYADKRVQTISQRVMTTANLSELITRYDLYPEERERFTLVTVVEEMREDISLEMISADVVDPRTGRPVEATIAFTLSYRNEFPVNAQRVVSELATLFLNENAKERRELAKEASVFLGDESQKLEDSIDELEAKIAVFKARYTESLPEMRDLNLQFLQRAEQELRNHDQNRRALDERIIYLEAEIAQLNPYSNLYSQTGERVLSTSDRLKALQSEYVSLTARYSDQHPDVIAARQELKALRQETGNTAGESADLQRMLTELQGEMASLSERYGPDHPDIARKKREIDSVNEQLAVLQVELQANRGQDADNPAYIQLQAQLQAAQAERDSLEQTRLQLQAEIDDLEQRLLNAPRVEQEYRTLMRDYESASLKFSEIKNKQLEAQLAEALEVESKAERFVLIEPPLLPEEPDSPNRPALLLLGLLLSLGVGGGYAALREAGDDSVHSVKELTRLIGTAPLAAIATIETIEDRVHDRRHLVVLVSGALILIGAAIFAVHMLYQPLDVLSIRVMRRFGF
jgi:uncharacterized protein involved in exopolysaccharide biosynthesis